VSRGMVLTLFMVASVQFPEGGVAVTLDGGSG
jgi:hypothetical protein